VGRITVGVEAGKRTHQVAIHDPMVDGILGQASLPGCGSSVCGGKTTAYTR
jgi:hypothetical protein